MKNLINAICTFSVALIFINNAMAHDPSKHKKMTSKPNCEAMKTMDTSEMDANDPVLQAMMKKCEPVSHDHSLESETKTAIVACTEEHAEMGHCTMTHDEPAVPSKSPESVKCTLEHAKMGHCAMSDDTPIEQGKSESD